jgi:hypothetical protein
MNAGSKIFLALKNKPAGLWTLELCVKVGIEHSQLKNALRCARRILAPGRRIEIIGTDIDKNAPEGMRRSSLYVLTNERI